MSTYSALIILLVFITIIALLVTNSNTNKAVSQTKITQKAITDSLDEHKSELKELKNLIKVKQQELENLVHATEQAKRRTITNLTVEQEEAIDLYERNNIRLPIDIIEELSYSNNVTYPSAVAFIEMQRKVWKAQFTVTMTKGMI